MAGFTLAFAPTSISFGRSDSKPTFANFGRSGYNGPEADFSRFGYNKDGDDDQGNKGRSGYNDPSDADECRGAEVLWSCQNSLLKDDTQHVLEVPKLAALFATRLGHQVF
ncbi:hypothetical protein B0T10DRAFT_577461 [Thelonectria olida]|uniref:Uncharacterized protein n=1 Tax=Thelonectria olida TaxID=1576542 RepID=A0A9P9APT7_9HYPO|nr:hypothetical protein B0T10DRAFT_577461 [Thelonectria olida]